MFFYTKRIGKRIKKYLVFLNSFDFFDGHDVNAASNIVPIDNFNKIEIRIISSFTDDR